METQHQMKCTELHEVLRALQYNPSAVVLATSEEDPNPIKAQQIFWGPYGQVFDPIETGFQPIVGSMLGKKIEVALTNDGKVVYRPHCSTARYGGWKEMRSEGSPLYLFITQ